MEEYKMRRGEHLGDRIPDMESTVEEYFGPISGTEEYRGNDLFVIEDPDNPVFDHVTVGTIEHSSKKDKLALDIEERPAEKIIEEGLTDAAEDAVSVKNEFLLEATGRDANARRDSMKRAVEDEPDEVDDV